MRGSDESPRLSFLERMGEFFDIVEFRQAIDGEDLEAIYRLRYNAYRRENFINSNAERICTDELDHVPNKHVFGIYIAGRLVSSIRLNILSWSHPYSPSMMAFGDIVQPWLDQGQIFIDPSRFVTDQEASIQFPELPMAMMKIPVMAAQYFNANYGLSSIRTEHAAFYKRIFRSRPVSKVRKFPYVDMQVILLKTETQDADRGVFARYPFYRSNYLDRRLLFRENSVLPLSRTENSMVHPA